MIIDKDNYSEKTADKKGGAEARKIDEVKGGITLERELIDLIEKANIGQKKDIIPKENNNACIKDYVPLQKACKKTGMKEDEFLIMMNKLNIYPEYKKINNGRRSYISKEDVNRILSISEEEIRRILEEARNKA